MVYTSDEARRTLLESLADAADAVGAALAAAGEAHELLDEQLAERLEGELFMPLQRAYGQTRRLHSDFARQSGLQAAEFTQRGRGAPSHGAKGFLQEALDAAARADAALAELQDSMLPVEVGDPQLRDGIAAVRTLLASVGPRGREILRSIGR